MTPSSPKKNEPPIHWSGWVAGVLLTVCVGAILLLPLSKVWHPLGDGLIRLSYDLPFLVQSHAPTNVVLVYIDANVKNSLGQPLDQPLDRHFYTELTDRLTEEGAKLILFDIIFDQPHPNAAVDVAFAAALRRNGHTVIIADYIKELNANGLAESTLPPIADLSQAAAGCGLARVLPDADGTIRELDTGIEDYPSASWAAARVLLAPEVKQPRFVRRWLNYYSRPGDFPSVPFDTALDTNGRPAGMFLNKIVCIGSRPLVGQAGALPDQFPNPWSRFGDRNSSGVSVHAQSLLNLLNGDWLVQLGSMQEAAVVLLWGIFITLFLMKLRPWIAIVVGLACAVIFGIVAVYLQLRLHVWFAWFIPAGAQTSVALVWSVGYQYAVVQRRRNKLRRAFGVYLSPHMVERIANSEFDLAPGGEEVEASVLFSDLESFTQMSETLQPTEVSNFLIAYFNQATRSIQQEDGTVIKFIGDAVLAVWNAPMPDQRHARRAVLAAWGMSQASREEIQGRRLRTRIGVNTGMVLVGNLGSDVRFDYTVIGDNVNFAARLESLNEYLGTDVLISETTANLLDGSIKLRALGRFMVSGKQNGVGIFEVLGLAKNFPEEPAWLVVFNQAREHFVKRELDAAEKLMREVIAQRGGKDGPAEFYLQQIAKARDIPADQFWDGTVKLDAK
jgi:adenylate cyclase